MQQSSLLQNTKVLLLIFGVLCFIIIGLFIAILASTAQPAQQTGPVTLTVWGFDDQSVYEDVFTAFEQQHPNVKISYEKQPVKLYFAKLKDRKAQNVQKADIFLFHNTWTPELTELLTPIPPSIVAPADYQKTFYKTAVNDLSLNNKLIGLPQSIDSLVLYYNPSLLSPKSVVPANDFTDWESFYNATTRLTSRATDGTIQTSGAAIGTAQNVTYFSDILGLMYLQQDLKHITDLGTSDSGNDIFQFYTRFADNLSGVWDNTQPQDVDAFAQGKTAVIFGTAATAAQIKAKNPQLAFSTAPTPQLPLNQNAAWATYWAWGVSSLSNQQALAWQLAWQLTSRANLVRENKVRTSEGGAALPYPRTDLALFQANDPILGAFITQAPYAGSFYYANLTMDDTADGPGIDDTNVAAWSDAVTAATTNKAFDLNNTRKAIVANLKSYGIPGF